MRVLLLASAAPPAGLSPFNTDEKLMPLGLGYLAAALESEGHQVQIVDLFAQPKKRPPSFSLFDLVCLSSNTVCFRSTRALLNEAELARKRGWKGLVLVGGPHASVAPETIPETADYVIQGEGEQALLELLQDRPADRILRRPRLTELDDLPLPAYHLFDLDAYAKTTDLIPDATNVFSYATSRGCPFRCTFCSANNIWGRRYTFKSPEKVVSDLAYLERRYGCDGIYFREDNFTVRRQRVLEICRLMREKNLGLRWATESRVDTLDAELLGAMKSAGCRGLYFGVEAGNDRRLARLSKGITVEQIERVFALTRELGLYRFASFIIDTPDETREDRLDLLRFIERIQPDRVSINHFSALPGSPLYDDVVHSGGYDYVDDVGIVHMPHKPYPLALEDRRTLAQRLRDLAYDSHPLERMSRSIRYRLGCLLERVRPPLGPKQ